MVTATPAHIADSDAARLMIYFEDTVGARGRYLRPVLRWLRAPFSHITQQKGAPVLNLQIEDLHGNEVLSIIAAPEPLTVVPLRAGTYRLTAIMGKVRRAYTLTLEQGTSFQLSLSFLSDSKR